MKKLYIISILFILLGLFICYQYFLETNVNDIDLGLNDQYKIVQITDLHYNTTPKVILNTAIKRINKENADLVVITGDFNTCQGEFAAFQNELIDKLKEIKSKDGVYIVFGNHDRFYDRDSVIKKLKEAKLYVLRDENMRLKDNLYLAGIDYTYKKHPKFSKAMKGIKDNASVVALIHSPTGLYHYTKDYSFLENKKLLFLIGHTHGNQINLPFTEKILSNRFYYTDFARGLRDFRGAKVYINRGIGVVYVPGTIYLPIRLNARPEVAIFNIK